MKLLLALILLSLHFSVFSQKDENKPSWSESLPERNDSPDMGVDMDLDSDMGMDREGLGFDREAMFDSDTSEDDSDSDGDELANTKQETKTKIDIVSNIQPAKEIEEKAAAEQLAAEKAAAEQLAAEKAAAEQIAAEKTATEELAIDKKNRDSNIDQEKAQVKNSVGLVQAEIPAKTTQTYKWNKTKNALPVYPTKAARSKTQGWVDVEVVIAPSGKVVGAHINKTSKNQSVFNNASLKAVRKWRYDPPINYGIQTNQSKIVRLQYKL